MSAGEQAARLEPRQVWRERRRGRMVVITKVAGALVTALDPEGIEEVRAPERAFRARFDYTGLDVRAEDPDGAPGEVETATLRGFEGRPSEWLRGLAAHATRRGAHDLAQLARQVLALRGENPDTEERR